MSDAESVPREVIIGLDVGTTYVKAVAFGIDRRWQCSGVRSQRMLSPQSGRQIQDPHEVLAAVQGALAECTDQLDGAHVVAMSVSAAMHGLIGLDGSYEPVTSLVTWADARAMVEARTLRSDGRAEALYRATGTPIHPMSPLVKLRWFVEHEPDTVAATRWWVGVKDWVLLWLTGSLVTEASTASASGLFDLRTRQWNPEALDAAGITAHVLPEVHPTTATLPLAAAAAENVGLPSGIPVVLGAGDGPSANVGTAAVSPGIAALSVGTSGALRVVVDAPGVDEAGNLFCYELTESLWVAGGAVSNGGSVAVWAGNALAPDLDGLDALLNLAAEVPPGSDGLMMLPYLVAERSPLWDPDLPGAYLGLRASHTRAHLARAAIEGVGLQLRVLLQQLENLAPVESVRATGGALGSPVWREVLAGALERPVCVLDDVEGTALGAAALGLYALGNVSDLGESVRSLFDVDAAAGHPLPVDDAMREVYRTMGSTLAAEIGSLESVAELFRRGPT